MIFLDDIVCKVRYQGTVKNKAAHIAVGVGTHGKQEELGIWVEHFGGAKKLWGREEIIKRDRGVLQGLSGLLWRGQTPEIQRGD